MLRGKAAPSFITGLTPGPPFVCLWNGHLLQQSFGEVPCLASALYR